MPRLAPPRAGRGPASWTSAAAAATRACRWRPPCRWGASGSSSRSARRPASWPWPRRRCGGLAGAAPPDLAGDGTAPATDARASRPSPNVPRTSPRSPMQRAAWDVVTARAVGSLAEVLELALPLTREGGLVVAWKREEERGGLRAELREAGSIIRAAGGGRPEVEVVEAPMPGRSSARHRAQGASHPGQLSRGRRASVAGAEARRRARLGRRSEPCRAGLTPARVVALLRSRPMRVAVLSDIHSNAPALEAVLEAVAPVRPALGPRRHRGLRAASRRGRGTPARPRAPWPCRATTTPPSSAASPRAPSTSWPGRPWPGRPRQQRRPPWPGWRTQPDTPRRGRLHAGPRQPARPALGVPHLRARWRAATWPPSRRPTAWSATRTSR